MCTLFVLQRRTHSPTTTIISHGDTSEMDSTSSRQKEGSWRSHRIASSTDRRTISAPLRELRRHLAAIQRLLDPGETGRSSSTPSMAESLCQSLCALARIARGTGLTTYCSLTLHVLEQLASAKRTRYVPADMRDLLRDWVRLSWLCLLSPPTPAHAIDLIAHMGQLRWERPVCRIQREALLESLQLEILHLAMHRNALRSSLRYRPS